MQNPAVPAPIPHVGGPITGSGAPTVLIGGLPAAKVGDMLVCVGPPDSIVKGSANRNDLRHARHTHGRQYSTTAAALFSDVSP